MQVSASRNYGMSVSFTSNGAISVGMTYGSATAYATAYLIIGVP